MNCECGYPITSPVRTMKESFFGAKRVIKEHEMICPKCKRINKVRG